jgi:hypothetical protein
MTLAVRIAAYILGLCASGLLGCGDDLNSTDCYADFPSERAASRVVTQAKAHGLSDIERVGEGRRPSIRLSSSATGADAAEFRKTARQLVRRGGGRMEKNTPCVERPPFN